MTGCCIRMHSECPDGGAVEVAEYFGQNIQHKESFKIRRIRDAIVGPDGRAQRTN
jgi:hypothetical protein